jgi:hypothetical protein
MACPNVISIAQMKVRIKNGTSKKARILEIKKDECKPVDVDKSRTNELTLEHTSMRAWNMKECISLATQNGFPTLDIIMEGMSIQLWITSSSWICLSFCKNSSNGGQNQKDLFAKDVS